MPENKYTEAFDNFIKELEQLVGVSSYGAERKEVDRITDKLSVALVGERQGDGVAACAITFLALLYQTRGTPDLYKTLYDLDKKEVV